MSAKSAITRRYDGRPDGRDGFRVGQIFKSQRASYSGQVAKDAMTLSVTIEDGTAMGPFTLTQGASPLLTRCL